MTTIQDRLRDADPLHIEPAPSAEARAHVRRAVLAASAGTSRPRPWPAGRRRVAVLVAAALGGLALVPSLRSWVAAPAYAAVRFELRLAEDRPGPGLRAAAVGAQPRLVYLHEEALLTNDDIAGARIVPGEDAGHPAVEVVFTPVGAARLRAATAAHLHRPVAVLIDGLVVMAPTVRSPFGESARLTGSFGADDAGRIVRGIRAR
ncbi:MAG: hypothetical protein AB7O28_06215 [Vicinamibacterales bacterium]